MQISLSKSPIHEDAVKLFNLPPEQVIFFTYGDCIYSPSKKMPPADIIRHEEMHAEQQNHNDEDAKRWWARYFADAEFRVEQEAEAYAAQFKFICANHKHGKDRNMQNKILTQIANMLSAPMYGNAISHADAMIKVRAYADGSAMSNIEDHMEE